MTNQTDTVLLREPLQILTVGVDTQTTLECTTIFAGMTDQQLISALGDLNKHVRYLKRVMHSRQLLEDECRCERVCRGCDSRSMMAEEDVSE